MNRGFTWAVDFTSLVANITDIENEKVDKKWRKLVRTKSGTTKKLTKARIVSIPLWVFWEMNIDPSKELKARWHVEDGKLFLEIKEVE
jgi:hypothetical protein